MTTYAQLTQQILDYTEVSTDVFTSTITSILKIEFYGMPIFLFLDLTSIPILQPPMDF